MPTRVGINGFGRIGRQVYKAIHDLHPDKVEVVAVNDLTDPKTNAHLLKYDSTYGAFPGDISATDRRDPGQRPDASRSLAERDPAAIPWRDRGHRHRRRVHRPLHQTPTRRAAHIDGGGAKKVIISAPAKGEDLTIVLGVNDDMYDPAKHQVISNASCTTNCIAPVVKVMHEAFGIRPGLHDHDPLLHQRPGHPRHRPRGPPPRPLCRHQHHPDDDRRREGRHARHAGAQGPPRRHGLPCADRHRLRLRLRRHGREANNRRRGQRDLPRRLLRGAARLTSATATSRSSPRTSRATRRAASSTRWPRWSSAATS